ncbi:fatty acid desaturase family protein [Enhygromyxa salina]|uniref:Fatty acid desaturase n=1 Tax=Enhygromyxa salina TaxID=215803 RepID=A0A2S9YWN5_9BACT|nr:fatty acid desaturase [Enhygromyxa salina]PRQ09483.1 Fatty acid desaturase [Enhygromyxa salina]
MTAFAAALTTQPSVRFRQRRAFYQLYDGAYLVMTSLVLALMLSVGWQGAVREFHWWYVLLLPLAIQAQILCSVFIHNCSHGNFPKPINRLVGELCGIVVLTRYASWEIIHRRHHKYSDDVEQDPHPITPDAPGYWAFLRQTIVNVEVQLQRQFFELHGGDTPDNRRFERRRAYTSYATNLVLIACWYVLLGPIGFFFFFVPASIIGFFHLIHFNWSTHNAAKPDQGFFPVNLDHGYYWLGNRIWFGIYYHGYHHKQANLFNPMRYEAHQQARAARLAGPATSAD